MIKKLLIALVLVTAVAAGGALFSWQSLLGWADEPVSVSKDLVVSVPPGTGPRAISRRLEQAGAVDDAEQFYRYVRFIRRVAGQLKAGDYRFSPDEPQSPTAVVERLLRGEVLSVKVTIPEGLRIDEIATLLAKAGLSTKKGLMVVASDPMVARALGVKGKSLEGYLFPDTYLLPQSSSARRIVELMVERFERSWAAANKHRDPSVTLSKHEAVTLASIVEKETGRATERPRISCVFHNRLKKNMKLQTDPTVIYAKILRTGSYDGNITRADLRAAHPYNTYTMRGLPPGPIASAGQAALEAALAPIECGDLFFVSRNDGSHVFCPTLRCHQAAVHKWQVKYFRDKRRRERQRR